MPDHAQPHRFTDDLVRQALRAGGILLWQWDLNTDRLTWSDNAEEVLGWTSGVPRDFDARVHPDDQARHQSALRATLQHGQPYDIEIRFLRPDGRVIWLQDKGELQPDRRNLSGVCINITARKEAEAEARASTALLRATVEHLDQGLIVLDASERIQVFNRSACDLLELPIELLQQRPAFEEVRQYQTRESEFTKAPEVNSEIAESSGLVLAPRTYEYERPDGRIIEVRTAPLPDGGAVRSYTDVTTRRQAEAKLQEKAAVLEATLQHMDQGLIMFDASETIQVFNARAAELLDIPAEYLATHPSFSELVQRQVEKDDFAKNDEVLRNWTTQSVAAAARQTYERERPDGTVLEVRTVPLEGGGAVLTYTDITARKAAEHALRDSEARFRTLTEAMPALVFVSNSDGRNEYVSPQYEAYTGLTAEELREAGWNRVVHPDDLSGATSPWSTARERGQPYSIECRVRRADGEYRWFTARAAPLRIASGRIERWMGACIDIHDLKLAEEALAQGEERLRLATEATGLGTYDTDLRTGWREWSPQTRAILGLSPHAPVGRRVMANLLHPEDRERVVAAHDQAILHPGSPLQLEFRIVRADTGEVRWVSSLSRVLCDAEGHPIRLVGTILDRTAAKQAHLALEESEARYRLLAQNTGDAIFLNGPDKVRRYVSPAVQEVLGYEPEALVGSRPEPMIHPDDLERVMPEFENVLAGHRHSSRTSTYRMRHAEGHWVPVEARRSVLRGETGEPEGVISVVRDISDRVALEERLRQSQKMEAIGALTGGIAHDFNNLLTVIIGNAELVADGAAGPDIAPTLARQILEAAEKGADLTQKLLAFARRQSLRPERLQVEQVITEMMPLLQRAIGEHIELSTTARRGSLAALTDRTLLESAILNLALNARDAMPQGGVLTISMEERLAGPGAGSLPVGQQVVSITVSDTGTGMPPEVLARAVEPFFTTKEVGKGSGLGLSMVYGFAEQSGGHVRIESEVSRGTAVTILLPAVALEAASVGVEADAGPAVMGSGRVLLVEDDPSVLTFVTGQLTSLGYDVEAVPTGVDALERLHRDSQFDLVFTDVMLPKGISGVELARKARNLNPKMKILLTSGYPEEVFHAQGRPDEGTLLLRKPYRRKELAETLRKVLDH